MANAWKKIWDFLWKSNSIWSWIVDFILIFLIVKFIVFPVVGLAMGTQLPFVIIESGSMEHKIVSYDAGIPANICGISFNKTNDVSSDFEQYWGYCSPWYDQHNITKDEFESWGYVRGMNKGDIIVVKGLKDFDYKEGDIIIFSRGAGYATPIIHRIIDVNEIDGAKVFSTKGDHNPDQLDYEKEISQEQVLGKAVTRIPKLGWIKLFFAQLFR